MTTTAPKTHPVRIQDLEPGMKVERLDADLNFIYPAVEKVVPQKVDGRTKSYKVYFVGYEPGAHQDASIRPSTVRTSGSGSTLAVLDES